MKRHLITAALAGLAFLGGLLLAILAVWAYWHYNHAPVTSSGGPPDVAAYVLIGLETFIGLPSGLTLGVIAGMIVLCRRLASPPPSP